MEPVNSSTDRQLDDKREWSTPELVTLKLDETFSGAQFSNAEGPYFTNTSP